jgi:hypothetical protein
MVLRPGIGREAAAADRRVEHVDALRAGALVERLDGVGLGGRRHRDHRSRRQRGQKSVRPEHDLVHLVVVADADDHETAHVRVAALAARFARQRGARHLGRSRRSCGARVARLRQLRFVEVAGGHRVAVPHQVLEHGEPHTSDADDADMLLGAAVAHGGCFPLQSLTLTRRRRRA